MSYDPNLFQMPTYTSPVVPSGSGAVSSFLPSTWSFGPQGGGSFDMGLGLPTTAPAQNWFQKSGFLGSKDVNGLETQGWGMPALGVAKGLFDGWMAMKSYGLAKQQLAEGKRQFGLNFDAQMKTTNAQLEDRQRARVASNPGAYQSVGDYMSKNAIRKGP